MTRARPGLKKCLMSEPVPALPQTVFSLRLVLTWSLFCSSASPLLSVRSVLTRKAAEEKYNELTQYCPGQLLPMSEIIAFFRLVLICGPE